MKRLIAVAIAAVGLAVTSLPAAASASYPQANICRPAHHWSEVPRRNTCHEPQAPARWYFSR